jgi:hypothetical protein
MRASPLPSLGPRSTVVRARAPVASRGAGARLALGALVAVVAACVPPGNAVPEDSGPAPKASAAAVFIPSIGIMTEPFFDDFERAADAAPAHTPHTPHTPPAADAAHEAGHAKTRGGDAAATAAEAATPTPPLATAEPVADPSGLGPNWRPSRTTAWRVEGGWLCGQGARNHGVWLNRVLPVNARIEFDARSESTEGDLKAEVWGDGQSGATGVSYTNATSYLAILGGWKNSIHVLARVNEHGKDRHELHVDPESDDARKRPVAKGQSYHFLIERTDGKTVRWSVNGAEMHAFSDPEPLAGRGHDHFGFNDWDAKVCFDNVRVTPL